MKGNLVFPNIKNILQLVIHAKPKHSISEPYHTLISISKFAKKKLPVLFIAVIAAFFIYTLIDQEANSLSNNYEISFLEELQDLLDYELAPSINYQFQNAIIRSQYINDNYSLRNSIYTYKIETFGHLQIKKIILRL